jgi:hypothetical protein
MPRSNANDKNASSIIKYMKILEDSDKRSIYDIPVEYGYRLGKVIKTPGGRLKVLIQDDTEELVLISKSVKIMGRAGNKTDRSNCMCVNDMIIIDGGFAVGKVPPATVMKILEIFKKHEYVLPSIFSLVSVASKEDDMFDYSDPVAKEEKCDSPTEDELEVDKI